MNRRLVFFLALAASAIVPIAVSAQTATGVIDGIVRDPDRQAVPGVTVVANSPSLIQRDLTAVSNQEGYYRLTLLPPGEYTVSYALPGFQTVQRTGLIVNAGQTTTIDIPLRLAAVEESVTVTGESPTVDPTGISRGRRDTHSTYFNLAAEVGLIGTMLFGALVLGILLHAERTRRRCRQFLPRSAQQLLYLELGLIGFLVAGIFGSYSKISFLYLHMGLIYSVTAACEEDLNRLTKGIPRLPQGSRRSAGSPTRGPGIPRQARA